MSAPAGWYPTPEGKMRYWDGTRWTEHFAPGASVSPTDATGSTSTLPPAAAPAPTRLRLSAWLGWGGLALAALLGLASSGVGGFFGLPAAYIMVVAVTVWVRGRVDWAHLRGRLHAVLVLAVGFGVAGVGYALDPTVDTADPTPIVASTTSPSPTPTESTATSTPSPTRTPTPSPTKSTATPTPAAEGTALAAVSQLAVKGRAPKTGYDRDEFGQAWYDLDRNGCDTRNDILRRDLQDFTLKAGTNGCLVLSGTLVGPYTGETIKFVRGTSTSSDVQIDHVVALSDAWQKGAQQLSASKRTALANDPLNLLAVDGPTNAAKGDGDAATWLPPRRNYRCAYVARQVAVKAKYDLWVTSAERDAITRILQTCPDRKIPTSKDIPLGGGTVKTVTPTPSPTKTSSSLDPRFGTCAEAIAAGYGPYYAGKDAEYDWYRDADKDGIVCES